MTIYSNLDEKIPINFFSGPQKLNSKSTSQIICAHLGSLIWDGFNNLEYKREHRIMCSKCGKRFGNDLEMINLLLYQEKIKMILYELFILKFPLTGVAIRWQIPQDKLSKFKKSFVSQVFQQNSEVIEQKLKALPRGVMLGDETYLGSRGNSDTEIVFINNEFETLSIGLADEGDLKTSILEAFHKIPEACRERLRVLITDGEPSYKSIAKIFGSKVIHVAQLHTQKQLGEVIISKYEKLGPHFLHYKIYTHWKAFYRNKYELSFKWEIKFIKGKIQKKRGRPRKADMSETKNERWRQKLEKYQSDSFQKEGTAKIFVNFETNKLSIRAGSKKWMIRMFTPIFKIFKGKHITTNKIESKHSQVKRNGAGRKQRDKEYGHVLFTLHAFLVEYGHIPFTNLAGRPLYNYLMKDENKKKIGYRIPEGKRIFVQTVLSGYE
ncbi:hypothetical protein ES708_17405 [subsurface metagenome]